MFSSCSDGDMCRPEMVAKATAPFLEVHAGRHPCVVQTFTGNEYIPNDTLINASQVNILLSLVIIFTVHVAVLSCCYWTQHGRQVNVNETNWTDSFIGSSCE